MKHISLFFLVLVLTVLSGNIKAQPWNSLLPETKSEKEKLTLLDYQQAFNDYWTPKNVEDGYYFIDGEKEKAGGWKQFKRWEWYWENRVNPLTGNFPATSAYEEYQKIKLSTDGNRSPSGQWISMGPSTSPGGYAGLGRLNCIGFHPTDNNTLYVGAAAGGIWKSIDGGSTWSPISDDLDAIGISDIIVLSTAGDDVVYIATGDRDHSDTYSVGVLKSTDGGTTWQNTGLTFTAQQNRIINRLLIDPLNDNIFYAATSIGVYKSTDAGVNWNVVTSTVFIDLEFKPGASNIIYGSNKDGDIYRSSDSGTTWNVSLSTGGKRTEIAISPNDPNLVYAVMANSSSGLYGVYKSTDSGLNFSSTFNSSNLLGWDCNGGGTNGQGWYDLCIASDPLDANTVFLGGVNTWKSVDGGYSWDINNHWSSTCSGSATTVHADKHNLVYQNGTSVLFECNDGGLYSTSNDGNTWNHLTNGMVISQIYRLSVAQTNSSDVIIGLQDNGTKSILNSTWEDVRGGDGMECIINYTNENTQYASIYNGNINRTTNYWVSSNNISSGIGGDAAWVTPYALDPNNSNTIYVGYQDVWKSANQGNSWTQISNWGGSTLRSLTIAPSNSDYIYAATTNTIYKTIDGGTTWTNITNTLPTGSSNITYISAKNDDPEHIWVSLGQFTNDCVFESSNGGSTWTDISGGLPSLPTNCVIQNRQNTSQIELYAATDVGVYLKLGGANWTQFSYNLPNVVVNELEIYYDDAVPSNSKVRAATFGRGLWESDLYSGSVTLSADFYANNTNIELNESVLFTDISTGMPTSWEWTFEGGTPGTHTGQTPPSILYTTEGTWDVTLIVSDGTNTETTTKTDYITVTDCSVSSFPYIEDFENNGAIPECWTQEYISGGSVDWQFISGNGDANPVSAYSGTYNACFTDQNTDEDKTILISPPFDLSSFSTAKVSFWHTQELWSPDQDELSIYYKVAKDSAWVLLVTYSNNISSWTQDSIDLINLSSSYYIGFEGNALYGYGVCLDYVEVTAITDIVTADFSADPTNGTMPLQVNFSDLSMGTINTWEWDFGDGNTSNDQNPVHTYDNTGTYTVSLTVTGPAGSDTHTKSDYILVTHPVPTADFQGIPTSGLKPLEVTFTDLSADSINTWQWEFGDGGTSGLQDPVYTYVDAGSYTVTLIVSGPGGSDTLTKPEYIIVTGLAANADFSGTPTTGEAPLTVSFTDLSTGDIDLWNWQFGDGNISSDQNPTHKYLSPGNFTVSLQIIGPGGNNTMVKSDYILIPVGLNDKPSEAIIVYPNPASGTLNIVFPNAIMRKLSLTNMEGIEVLKCTTSKKNETINLHDITVGIYTLTINDGVKNEVIKVVKN